MFYSYIISPFILENLTQKELQGQQDDVSRWSRQAADVGLVALSLQLAFKISRPHTNRVKVDTRDALI